MPQTDRRRTRRRWTGVAALGLITAAFGLGGVQSPVVAQAGGADQFGGFNLTGRANGIQVSYNVENVFPLPPPLVQFSVPEALSTSQSGPSSTALGSAAFPGNVIGNLPAIIEQASPGNGSFVPPYPLATRADYPAGPFEGSQDIGTASASVAAGENGSQAISTMSASSIPGIIEFGAITTSGQTGIEGDQVVARSRAEVSSIKLLFGLIELRGVVTELIATSNGEVADAVGTTTLGGIYVLGLPATLGADGLVVDPFTPPPSATPLDPLLGQLPLGDLGIGDVANQLVVPINDLVQQVLGGADVLNELLAATGLSIQVLEPIVEVNGAEASITSNGLYIALNYVGSTSPLGQILSEIDDGLPGQGLPGVPINTSPQAIAGLLQETHVTSLALAYGEASVVASPSFSFTATPPARAGTGTAAPASSGSPGTPGRPGTPGFSTPTPNLPTATGTQPIAGDGSGGGVGGNAIGVLAVALALVLTPFWGFISGKLADNSLKAVVNSCPQGLDGPIPTGGN